MINLTIDGLRWYKVKVFFPDINLGNDFILPSEVWEDEILGETTLEALQGAVCNWPMAEWIELI